MLLKPIAAFLVKLKLKKYKNIKTDIGFFSKKSFEDIKSIMVISPNGKSNSVNAKEAIDILQSQFSDSEIFYLDTESFPDKSISLWGLPKKIYLDQFSVKNFDIIIDLNREFSLLNTYLIAIMNRAIKIKSYNDTRNDIYYDFIFESNKKSYVDITRHMLSMMHHVLSQKIIK